MKARELICYGIYISNKFETPEETKRRIRSIYETLKRIKKKSENYESIEFILGMSHTDAHKTITVEFMHTGKKGRPKRVLKGTNVPLHIHIYVISKSGYVSSFCNEARGRLIKKKYIVHIRKNNNPFEAINYLLKQSDYKLSNGDILSHVFNP